MDRTERRIGPALARAAAIFALAAFLLWAMLPNGDAARIERHAPCYDPARLPPVIERSDGQRAMRLSILLYNVEGLPFPARLERKGQLNRIAGWLERRRAAGQAPDIVFLHKAFTPAASAITAAGGYDWILPGPSRDLKRSPAAAAPRPAGYDAGARWFKGEGVGKWLDSGLYIATDLPLLVLHTAPFSSGACAGYDCLANKGGMVATLIIPGVPEPIRLFNTHRNSREPSGVAIARAEAAHRIQTMENDRLLAQTMAGPIIAAGDFNMRRAGDRTGRFASDIGFRLIAPQSGDGMAARPAAMSDESAWAALQDLIGVASGAKVEIAPLAVTSLFDGTRGPRLSDHNATYAVVELRWRGDTPSLAHFAPPPCSEPKGI
ncbi:hypothetical protein [Sphingopyxis flava]|uniref:Endonuclease/Exonuclease/phosphatase family protein n=1 Tax=Sphingopyxis flava TaxID=1507287 RepID=A0A1T5DLW2_9SPHN|nr:hypothetical protein [Sphingopyxis flava]SKB72702.1 Endonuclease/Exonuclease/phosphatase family protein [Sphingopyxis flava]